MAKGDEGRVLTSEEEAEYVSFLNQRLPVPDKFDGVVFDNTAPTGAVYRFPGAEEREAGDAAAKAARDASDAVLKAEAAARKAAGMPETVGAVNIPNRVPIEADNTPKTPGAPGGVGDDGDGGTRQTPRGNKAP